VHLERATALRLEAAEAAESLTRISRDVAAQLGQADERLGTLNGLSRELEGKIAGLASIQERIGRFEARLAEWRGVERQVADALENAMSRRATISALEGEIRGLYELAAQVLGDARAVAESEPQWARARAEVDAALARLAELDRATRGLESRCQQLEKVDERLAYADALLDDLRGALEVLVAEKAQVDHLFDKAAALPLETRRVEALIEILREERRVSERVRGAVAGIRRREGEREVVG
jgi:DNA repair ATPase RecN